MDLLEVRFLPLGKKTIQPFSRAGGIQAKMARQKRPNGLCVLAAISEKAGWFFCPGVKIEPPVGPQQPQIGGIESSFFWPTGTSNDVCGAIVHNSLVNR